MTTMFDEKNVSFGLSYFWQLVYVIVLFLYGSDSVDYMGISAHFCQVPAFAKETTNLVINVLFCYFNLFYK